MYALEIRSSREDSVPISQYFFQIRPNKSTVIGQEFCTDKPQAVNNVLQVDLSRVVRTE